MVIRRVGLLLRNAVELLGRHPLATGILAVLSVVGFVFSVYTYRAGTADALDTSRKLDRSLDAMTSIERNVQGITAATTALCAMPPCWGLQEFLNRETIGKPKDLLDAKLAPASRKEDGQFIHSIDGCIVSIEYIEGAVAFFSAALFKYVEVEGKSNQFGGPATERQPCGVPVARLLNTEDRTELSDNDKLTVGDALTLIAPAERCNGCAPPDLRIFSACLDCGNAAEPYLEFMRLGSHAELGINAYLTTSFDALEGIEAGADDPYLKFREAMRHHLGEGSSVTEIEPLCGFNIYPDIHEILSRSHLTAVGVGVARSSTPNVLTCKRWG